MGGLRTNSCCRQKKAAQQNITPVLQRNDAQDQRRFCALMRVALALALPCGADELAQINPYAVEFRYGDEVIQSMSKEEIDAIAKRILNWAEMTVACNHDGSIFQKIVNPRWF